MNAYILYFAGKKIGYLTSLIPLKIKEQLDLNENKYKIVNIRHIAITAQTNSIKKEEEQHHVLHAKVFLINA